MNGGKILFGQDPIQTPASPFFSNKTEDQRIESVENSLTQTARRILCCQTLFREKSLLHLNLNTSTLRDFHSQKLESTTHNLLIINHPILITNSLSLFHFLHFSLTSFWQHVPGKEHFGSEIQQSPVRVSFG